MITKQKCEQFSAKADHYAVYRPFLSKYMDNKQRQVYDKFYALVGAQSISIELEEISSNFVRYKHPSTVDMVICYKNDKEIRVPVLELYRKTACA